MDDFAGFRNVHCNEGQLSAPHGTPLFFFGGGRQLAPCFPNLPYQREERPSLLRVVSTRTNSEESTKIKGRHQHKHGGSRKEGMVHTDLSPLLGCIQTRRCTKTKTTRKETVFLVSSEENKQLADRSF